MAALVARCRRTACLTMRRLCVPLVIVLAAACRESALTPMGTASLVLSEIRLRGAAPVARRMDTDAKFARSVLDGIATGDSAWIEVAKAIEPGSSAVDASLTIALATALPLAPRAVLPLLGATHAAEEVCGIPFLQPSKDRITRYRDSALAAVLAVDVTTTARAGSAAPFPDTALRRKRGSCAAALRGSAERKLTRIDPAYVVKNKPVVPKKPPPKKRTRKTPRRR